MRTGTSAREAAGGSRSRVRRHSAGVDADHTVLQPFLSMGSGRGNFGRGTRAKPAVLSAAASKHPVEIAVNVVLERKKKHGLMLIIIDRLSDNQLIPIRNPEKMRVAFIDLGAMAERTLRRSSFMLLWLFGVGKARDHVVWR